jgi:hypothetical protein
MPSGLRLAHSAIARAVSFLALLACLSSSAALGQTGRPPREPTVFLPGFGLGVAVGLESVGGKADDLIGSATGFDGTLHYGFESGLLIHAGIHVGRHSIGSVGYPYQVVRAYVEPRYAAQWISPAWAPFVAAQVGYVWETVDRFSMNLRASGLSLGGGGGVALQLTPQLALEGGALMGITRFRDYTFRGERAWYECLNLLEPGTPLPESVQHCAGTINAGAVLCYPPFYSPDRVSGDCSPPDIPYHGTARSATWLRLWLGASVSFASPG